MLKMSTLKELAREIEIIKNNHLAHMAEDIDRVEGKVDKIDNRIWAILIILCGATFVPMILAFIKTS
jgi:hypothetical protein